MEEALQYAMSVVHVIATSQFAFLDLPRLAQSLIIVEACRSKNFFSTHVAKKTFLSLRMASKTLCEMVGLYAPQSFMSLKTDLYPAPLYRRDASVFFLLFKHLAHPD